MFDSNPVPLYDPNRCSVRSPAFGKTEGSDAAHVLKRKMSCTFFSTEETDTNYERSRIRVSRLLSDRVSPRTAAPLSPDDVWPRGTRSVPHLAPIASSQNRLGLAAPTPTPPCPGSRRLHQPPVPAACWPPRIKQTRVHASKALLQERNGHTHPQPHVTPPRRPQLLALPLPLPPPPPARAARRRRRRRATAIQSQVPQARSTRSASAADRSCSLIESLLGLASGAAAGPRPRLLLLRRRGGWPRRRRRGRWCGCGCLRRACSVSTRRRQRAPRPRPASRSRTRGGGRRRGTGRTHPRWSRRARWRRPGAPRRSCSRYERIGGRSPARVASYWPLVLGGGCDL